VLDEFSHGYPDQSPLISTERVDHRELSMFGERKLRAAPLLSGVLRRIALWRSVSRFVVRAPNFDVSIEWEGGPQAWTVAAILGRSACAVAQVTIDASTTGNRHRIDITPCRESSLVVAEPADAWDALSAVQGEARRALAPCLDRQLVSYQLWGTPDMGEAVRRRKFTAVYRMCRRAGLSVVEIAGMTGRPQAEVDEILMGQVARSDDIARKIVEGLGFPYRRVGGAPL
jgi:hypothetical protein